MTKKKDAAKSKHSKLAKSAGRKMKWRKRMPVLIIFAVIVAGVMFYLDGYQKSASKSDEGNVKSYSAINFKKQGELSFTEAGGKSISHSDIEIADDDSKRANGMMYRSKMEEDQGMLFIFPNEAYQSFWMLNTVLSLDIIFINADREIVNIHKGTTPFSKQSYPSTAPAQFVVEVLAGYCDRHGIKAGDKIVWRRL